MNKLMAKIAFALAFNFVAVVEATSWLSAPNDFLFIAGIVCLFLLFIADVTFIRYLLKSHGKKEPNNVGSAESEAVEREEHF